MVYDGVHNPAVRLSDTGADSYCCADAYACTCGYAYPRADTNAYAYADHYADTTAGVYGYACSYSYSCTNSNPYTDSHADANANGYAGSGFEFGRSYCIYGLLKWSRCMLLGLLQHFHHECQWNWYYSVDADYKQVRLPI